MKQLIHSFDAAVTTKILQIPRSFDPFFLSVTVLGDPIMTVLIGAAVALWGLALHAGRMVAAGLAVPLTLILGYGMKITFERARPTGLHEYSARLDTFSFPSGHSSGSAIAYGLLAYLAFQLLPAPWNIVACVILGVIPVLVGVSRIYLGVHYPSDVLAGWLLGLAVLLLVIFAVQPVLGMAGLR